VADYRDRLVFKVPRIIEGEASGRFAILRRLLVADNRDRLNLKFFRFVEGEAVGRFAITVFAFLVLALLVSALVLGRPFAYQLGWAVLNGAEGVSAFHPDAAPA
jgi:hypothetical protein